MQLVRVNPQGITAISIRDKATFAGERNTRFRVRRQGFDRIVGINEKTGGPIKAAKLLLVDVDARATKCGDFVICTCQGPVLDKLDWEEMRELADRLNHGWITKEQAREEYLSHHQLIP